MSDLVRASICAAVVSLLPACQSREPIHERTGPVTRTLTEDASLRLQSRLDELRVEHEFVGATAAIVLPDGSTGAAATGWADVERQIEMTPDHRMPAGSIGKTIAGATALSMVSDGLLQLDDLAGRWLGREPWLGRLANHETITLRHLLTHSSGLIDHVYDEDWRRATRARWTRPDGDPDSYLTPRESISYILDKPALFAAGAGFHYTDTGYLLVGLVLEAASGAAFYVEAQRRIVDSNGLSRTEAQRGRHFANLAAGYLGSDDDRANKVADQDIVAWNTLDEWTGGGYVSNSQDLARWGKALYEGQALPTLYLDEMLASGYRGDDVESTYGISVFIVDNELGRILGHGGEYPGWRSSMYYHPQTGTSLALQVNQFEPDVHNILRQELFKAVLEVVGDRQGTDMEPRESSFRSADVPIRYTDVGTGPPVLLIHGYTGGLDMWRELTPHLSSRFRVIALDCRGHGQSGKPHEEGAYGAEMVADLGRLLDELEINKAHLVGYSMGAEIALKLTTVHPDRVSSLLMGGSGWSGPPEYALYRGLGDALEESGSFAPLLRALAPENAAPPSDEEIAAMDELLAGNDLDALTAVARGMNGIIDVTAEELANLEVPVLGIAGENDPERANLEKMEGIVENFTMKVLADRDHMSALTDPAFNELIADFLDAAR